MSSPQHEPAEVLEDAPIDPSAKKPSASVLSSVTTDPFLKFPDELKRSDRWCVWKYMERGGKRTKLPFQVNGKPAESNNTDTWTNYQAALAASSRFEGIGCMISTPYVAVDFDHVRNKDTGEIEPWALAAINELNSYTELSPSGTGFHVWCYGKVSGAGKRKGRVELYAKGRYFTVSGLHLEGTPLSVNELPSGFYAAIESLDPQHAPSAPAIKNERVTKSQKIRFLSNGDWKSAGFPSQSEADCAWCIHLAELFNGDNEKIDEEFRKCPLMRPKWDVIHNGSDTYGAMTIATALSRYKAKPRSRAQWECLENVEEEVLDWLWKDRIVLGKLNLFTGNPDMAKSMIAVYIASVVNTASTWADGQENELPPSSVLILSSEDDIADTVKPRLRAAGGDPKLVHCLRSMVDESTETQFERSFALDQDIRTLREKIDELGNVKLIILDPVSAYFSSEKSINSEQDVREVLEPLRLLCAEKSVAAICLAHFNKTIGLAAIQKTLGATALTAIMRMGWAFIESENEEDVRLMLCFKGNMTGKKKRGLKYTTEGVDLTFPSGKTANIGRVKWLGDSDANINERLFTPTQDRISAREALDWLREELKDGDWKSSKFLNGKAAHDLECSKKTLQRAAKELNVEKQSKQGDCHWRLPQQQANLIGQGEM